MSHKSLTQRGYVVKKKHLTKEQIKKIEKDLTFQPLVMEAFSNLSKPKKFFTYLESIHRYYLPRYYGEEAFGAPEANNLIQSGADTNYQVYWDLLPHQYTIWDKITEQFMDKGKGGILSIPCGAGKTFLAIKLGATLKKKMIVVVNKEFLLKQWKDAITKCSNARVGIIQQNKIDVEDKDIVIAMLHSLSMKDYPEELFKDFGVAVVDECFPYEQYINTDQGPVQIGVLYNMWENKIALPRILSFNEQTKRFEYKNMTYAWKKRNNKLIQFKLDKNIVRCTENHRFLTANGWMEAKNINVGDSIKGYCKNLWGNRCNDYGHIKVSEKEVFDYANENENEKENEKGEVVVYDIEVEDNHNFLVCGDNLNTVDMGVIAHNCHHISSQTFSQALPKIACQYTLGLSATPIRKDGLTQVFLNYLGPIFHCEKRTNTNKVWIKFMEISSSVENFDVEVMKSTGTKDTGKMTTNISNFETMNYLILEMCRILIKNPERPRKILILGARRDQLDWLHEKWQEMGCMNYNNKYATGGLYYGNQQMNKKEYWKMLDESAKCDILWGTNEIAKEGLDIPDLNTLILLSGGTDVEQAVGRILRKYHEKVPPTVIDMVYKCGNFTKHAASRRDYYEQNEYLCHKLSIDIDNDVDKSIKQQSAIIEQFLESYTEKGIMRPLKKNKQRQTAPLANRPTDFGSFKVDADSSNSSNGSNDLGDNGNNEENNSNNDEENNNNNDNDIKNDNNADIGAIVHLDNKKETKKDNGKIPVVEIKKKTSDLKPNSWDSEEDDFDNDENDNNLLGNLDYDNMCIIESDDESPVKINSDSYDDYLPTIREGVEIIMPTLTKKGLALSSTDTLMRSSSSDTRSARIISPSSDTRSAPILSSKDSKDSYDTLSDDSNATSVSMNGSKKIDLKNLTMMKLSDKKSTMPTSVVVKSEFTNKNKSKISLPTMSVSNNEIKTTNKRSLLIPTSTEQLNTRHNSTNSINSSSNNNTNTSNSNNGFLLNRSNSPSITKAIIENIDEIESMTKETKEVTTEITTKVTKEVIKKDEKSITTNIISNIKTGGKTPLQVPVVEKVVKKFSMTCI